jgi:ribosomal protein RSM22 (predicted rRNA methylase)
VIVEAGTPRGFEIVLEAREALLIREDKVKTDTKVSP